MAIVPDLSGNNPTDKSWVVANRVVADEPNTVLIPEYVGEIVHDTMNNCLWKSMGLAGDRWVAITPPA